MDIRADPEETTELVGAEVGGSRIRYGLSGVVQGRGRKIARLATTTCHPLPFGPMEINIGPNQQSDDVTLGKARGVAQVLEIDAGLKSIGNGAGLELAVVEDTPTVDPPGWARVSVLMSVAKL